MCIHWVRHSISAFRLIPTSVTLTAGDAILIAFQDHGNYLALIEDAAQRFHSLYCKEFYLFKLKKLSVCKILHAISGLYSISVSLLGCGTLLLMNSVHRPKTANLKLCISTHAFNLRLYYEYASVM